MVMWPALTRRGFLGCACCTGLAPGLAASAAADPDGPTSLELGLPGMTRLAPSVWVTTIAPGVWLYTTTALLAPGLVFPSNGLLIEDGHQSILIDPGTHPDQARVLLHWAQGMGRPVCLAVSTHFHSDRTGGIPAVREAGIRAVASPLTCALARRSGQPVPAPIDGFTDGALSIRPGLELFFPGAGHTRDNIVAWLTGPRVLFGGCLLKSSTNADLGYVADAVIADWPGSVRRVRDRYQAAAFVIPGHGTIRGDAIGRTLSLLKA
jgi:metallo-beta-lactamase class B